MSKKCRHEILLDSGIQANTKMKEECRQLKELSDYRIKELG